MSPTAGSTSRRATAYLVRDLNGNGLVDNGAEMFEDGRAGFTGELNLYA